MNREERYIVLKIADVNNALTYSDQQMLQLIADIVARYRAKAGKHPMECVVVECDWPEYEAVWKMIADRVDGVAPVSAEPVNTMRMASALEHANSEIVRLEEVVRELKVKTFAHFNNQECWIYQGDGDDHLESLVCPVVIQPKKLMEIIAAGQVNARLMDVLNDLVSASVNEVSCQRGVVEKCHCIQCSRIRAREFIAAAEQAKPDPKMVCGCGRPTRYEVSGGKYACNKYARCAEQAKPAPECGDGTEASTAAIEFALTQGSGDIHGFLSAWLHGDFDVLRKEWPEAPEAIYIGADPMFKRELQGE